MYIDWAIQGDIIPKQRNWFTRLHNRYLISAIVSKKPRR
jgi:hypothetical protein